MDASSPIQAYLEGEIGEGQLLAAVDRVLTDGSAPARTALLNDWRTKSGRIQRAHIRERLDARVQAFTWSMSGDGEDTIAAQPGRRLGRILKPGDVLAQRFVIEEAIGSGGMGTVFKARDLRREEAQDRHPYVAVKTLSLELLRRDDSLKILQREARKAQNLSHPNIVRVYDFDRADDTIFLTMELLQGLSLEAMIQANGRQGMMMQDALPILDQVATALEFAHAEGIVHSDLKPANIFILSTGRVKVIDFGIARAIPKAGQVTIDRTTFDVQALGALTPAYASPEMIEGQEPDPRDDVFALACIAYELLTGSHPFGRTPALAAQAANLKAARPAGLSTRQWKALQAGLQFDRSQRTLSPKTLIAGLQAKPLLWPSRTLAWQTGTGLSVVAILAVLWLYGNDRPKPSDQTASPGVDHQRTQTEAPSQVTPQQTQEQEAQKRAQQQSEEAAKRQAQQQADEAAARTLALQQAEEQERLARQQADEEARRLAQQRAEQEAASRLAEQRAEEAAKPQVQQQQQQPEVVGSAEIAEAQRLLNALGLNAGDADGKIGPRTQEMVRAFQSLIGEPATGEVTPALIESLHRTQPSTEARARSLFSLASTAARSRRFGDAIRLYELGLALAPGDSDALLALGDIHRDRGDYEAARRYYGSLQRSGGSAANIGGERLAALSKQQELAAKPETSARPGASTDAASSRTAVRSQPGQPFDGTYVGTRQLVGLSSPNCPANPAIRLEIRNSSFTFERNAQIAVAADGTFSGTGTVGVPPMVQYLTGKISGSSIEADSKNPVCKYHMSLRKVSP